MLKTLQKEAAREFVRQYFTEHLEPLLAAQIDNAVGIKHLMVLDPKTGKFERITDVEQIDEALKSDTAILDLHERSERASVHGIVKPCAGQARRACPDRGPRCRTIDDSLATR